MKFSRYLIPTIKETPKKTKAISHKLLIRSGAMQISTSGIYTYLPQGWQIIKKIRNIIEKEMNTLSANELSMPIIQPFNLWQASGRWTEYSNELIKIKDRKNINFCLSPTHEEISTITIKKNIKSYKEFPIIIYQNQPKFRDELRPRAGLIRSKEFLMKDAYSFVLNYRIAKKIYFYFIYLYMYIFKILNIQYKIINANSGVIGGEESHEFQNPNANGESEYIYCLGCKKGYEISTYKFFIKNTLKNNKLNFHYKEIKILLIKIKKKYIFILLEKQYTISENKIKELYPFNEIVFFNDVNKIFSSSYFNLLKLILKNNSKNIMYSIIADLSLIKNNNIIIYNDINKKHEYNMVPKEDFKRIVFADIRNACKKDKCNKCMNNIIIEKGIEVGHTFYLGKKYSNLFELFYNNKVDKKIIIEMGCYGIGVSRLMSVIVEDNYLKNKILWPMNITAFKISIISFNNSDLVQHIASLIYETIKEKDINILYDERNETLGVKLNDNDLIGSPILILINVNLLKNKRIEIRNYNNKIHKIKFRCNIFKYSINNICNTIIKLLRKEENY